MAKIWVQNVENVLVGPCTLSGCNSGDGQTISGSVVCSGFSRLVGMLSLSASLQTGSGLTVYQSADGGTNWDVKSACQTLPAGASTFSYELYGSGVKVLIANGSSANAVRTLWKILPFQTPDKITVSSITGGSVAVTAGSFVATNQISASVSGGSLAMLAGENHIGEVGGRTVAVSACVTRPNNSASYIAGDMWADATTNGTLLRFPNCARLDAGAGVINSIIVANSASLTTQPQIYLWLFKSTITSPSDNAPFPMTNAEVEKCIGMIDFSSWYAGGSTLNSISYQRNLNIPFVCQSGCNSLWGVPIVMNSCSPNALQNLQFRLTIFQD